MLDFVLDFVWVEEEERMMVEVEEDSTLLEQK